MIKDKRKEDKHIYETGRKKRGKEGMRNRGTVGRERKGEG